MNGKQAIKAALGFSSLVLGKYTDDLSDQDLLKRPGVGCNHLAWQLGHLIAAEAGLLQMVAPGTVVELPAGFKEKHEKTNAGSDKPEDFCTRAEYMQLFDKVHAATTAALDATPDASLDAPSSGNFQQLFPTQGHVWMLIATHGLMHAGQFVPVRRALGKPVVI